MPDEQSDDIFSAWGRAQAADPATRRFGVMATPSTAPTAPAPVSPPPTEASSASSAPAAPEPTSPPPAFDGRSIVATATSQIGKTAPAIRPFLQTTGQSLDPTRLNWCAAFVNGVLNANGIEGVTGPTKNIATSFLGWGQPVQGDVQPGDVLVQPRGHPMGGLGGHIGIATGDIATGNGRTYYLMQSGNYAGRVSYSWEPAGSVVARRAPTKQGADDAQASR